MFYTLLKALGAYCLCSQSCDPIVVRHSIELSSASEGWLPGNNTSILLPIVYRRECPPSIVPVFNVCLNSLRLR